MLIYVDQISDRISFVLDFVFTDRGLRYELTNDEVRFIDFKGDKFNFSERFFSDSSQVVPSGILLAEDMVDFEISTTEVSGESCLSFNGVPDLLGSIFFILSRYEEYGEVELDNHGRLQGKDSVLAKNNWIHQLKCERWAEAFLNELRKSFDLEVLSIPSRFVASFDIDNAYAFKNRDGVRLVGSVVRDFLKRDKQRIAIRKAVKANDEVDPYDTFEKIISLKNRVDDVKVFWLLADYSKFNKNIRHSHPKQARLIRKVAENLEVGIHPGYESWNNKRLVDQQLKRLKTILNRNVVSSRQHFLRFRFPATPKNLSASGIEHDYSLGYSDVVGFRAGTARAFPFFDLKKNETTSLILHPFAYMDGTLKDYLKISVEESILLTNSLIDEVKCYGGDFIPVWHNETIGDYGSWKGWSAVLESNIKYFYDE